MKSIKIKVSKAAEEKSVVWSSQKSLENPDSVCKKEDKAQVVPQKDGGIFAPCFQRINPQKWPESN